MRTYTYKAKLSAPAHKRLDEFLEQQRILYNCALQERMDCHKKTGKSISKYDQDKSLTIIRDEDADFSKFHCRSQRSALCRLDMAYKRFFKHGGYPRFKGRGRVRSFAADGVRPCFNDKYGTIKIKGIGRIRWKRDERCTKDDVKLVRIVKYPDGVHVQLVCEVNPEMKGSDASIGIDVGVKDRAVLSDGTKIPKNVADTKRKKRLQRKLARAIKGSNNRKKKGSAYAKECHRQKIRTRNDLHAITTSIVRNHGKHIAVEDLKIQNMTAKGGSHKRGLNRSILEQNWGAFAQQLAYKAESAGGWLVKVNPKNTTQRCSACGSLPQTKLTLSDRWYSCATCGHSEDRDINASKNILLEGLTVLDSGGYIPEAWVEGRKNAVGYDTSTQNSLKQHSGGEATTKFHIPPDHSIVDGEQF